MDSGKTKTYCLVGETSTCRPSCPKTETGTPTIAAIGTTRLRKLLLCIVLPSYSCFDFICHLRDLLIRCKPVLDFPGSIHINPPVIQFLGNGDHCDDGIVGYTVGQPCCVVGQRVSGYGSGDTHCPDHSPALRSRVYFGLFKYLNPSLSDHPILTRPEGEL